jgi:hypothetical protein
VKRLSSPTAVLFMVLSVCDLALTWWLLERSGRAVFEGNPVANWWLSRHGWFGLAGFKAAVVFMVVLLTGIIARQRPRAAGNVLAFACAALTAVVIHGAVLGQTAPAACELPQDINRGLEEINVQTRRVAAGTKAYTEFLDRMVERVAAGESTLAEAVQRLMKWERNRDPGRQRTLMSVFRGRSMEEALARQMLSFVEELGALASVEYRLRLEYEALFGADPTAQQLAGQQPA